MKKFLILIMLGCIIMLGAFAVNAEENDFTVDITGDSVVAAGSEVSYTVSVNNIKVEGGLASVEVLIHYDTEFFDASTIKTEKAKIDGWEVIVLTKTEGKITFRAYSEMDEDGNLTGITENGKINFVFTMKVLSDAKEADGDEIYVDTDTENNTYGGDKLTNYVTNVGCGKLSISLFKALSAPTSLTFDENGVASWDAVENATSYIVQLYKNGKKYSEIEKTENTSFDFMSKIKENYGADFTFSVKAVSTEAVYSDSPEAKLDDAKAYKHRGVLQKPELNVSVDRLKGTVSYKITDNNPDGTVGSYILRIYAKGENEVIHEITGITSESMSGNIDFDFEGGKEYDITAEAVTANGSENGNSSSPESIKMTVKADNVTGIKITKNPLLSYVEGETLNLSSMVVTITFASSDDLNVSQKNFSKYSITTSLKHGADLTLSMNGKEITVKMGSFEAKEKLVLEIESAECKHTKTEDEHLDPTCGVNGYDRTVCSLCGETISETVLDATEEHEFTPWEWLFEPTQGIDGVRQRRCLSCGKSIEEQVPYEAWVGTSTDTTEPEDTTPEETKQPETTQSEEETTKASEKGSSFGALGNVGKIFLFALLGIFIIIVLFIVIAIWTESRRNKRRRAAARANRNNSYRNNTNRRS